MPNQTPIQLSQVLKDEYVSFHGGSFPTEYLTWSFYKDHIVDPTRFVIKLRQTGAEDAPDSLEVYLRKKVEAIVGEELDNYVRQIAKQSPSVVEKALQNAELDDRIVAPPDSLQDVIVSQLNFLLKKQNLYKYFEQEVTEAALKRVGIDRTVKDLDDKPDNPLTGMDLFYVNRLLLEEAYPKDVYKINDTLSGIYAHIHRQRHSALCVSGGGIRSASFGLGVVQGLARYDLLDRFEYLSTVSGGGYLGSWLSAWIHRHPKKLEGVKADLANFQIDSKLNPEPEPIRHLRAYSNYLSPKLGLLSADTWTLVSTFFRNLILNWLVLVPFIAAVIMFPRICSAVIEWVPDPSRRMFALRSLFILGFLGAAISVAYQGVSRPSLGSRRGQRVFLLVCLLPLLVSAVSFTTFWAWYRNQTNGDSVANHTPLFGSFSTFLADWSSGHSWLPSWQWDDLNSFVAFGIFLHLSAAALVLLTWGVFWVIGKVRGKRIKAEDENEPEPRRADDRKYRFREFLLIVSTGALGGLAAYLGAVKLFPVPQDRAEYYVCFAAPLFLLFFLLIVTVFTGFSGWWTDDEDREWWGRLGAWVLIPAAAWSLISPLVIFGPVLLKWIPEYVASIGGISSVITLVLGRSSKTSAYEKQKEKAGVTTLIMDKAVTLAGPIFAAFIVIIISVLSTFLIRWVADKLEFNIDWRANPALADPGRLGGYGIYSHLGVLRQTPAWFVLVAEALIIAFGFLMAKWINTNKFSLHAMYRNRLIRAYLGASNDKRNPNRFTGFDEHDNIAMHSLWPNTKTDKTRRKLLHIVNMALNLVSGDNLAWQQRKAESFTVSPLHAGSLNLGYRRIEYKDTPPDEVEKRFYGGPTGISLGTAVTISGAAASPNMGYHSSPVIAFLLSLFNIRLGWWLGNPGKAGDDTYHLAAPKLAVQPIVAETLGLTDDKSPYVYLSDGGHFENLGLYEMLVRRCHFILVSDASQDQGFTFEDLGNAVRKIRIDLGIPIDLDQPVCIFPRSDDDGKNGDGRYCAVGTIKYSCVDNPHQDEQAILPDGHPNKSIADGILIYIKPAFYGKEPRDIYQYAKANPFFPHESTGDQFFSESQLESYRMLGSHTLDIMLEDWKGGDRYFDNFNVTGQFGFIRDYIYKHYLNSKHDESHRLSTQVSKGTGRS
jgi:hypothetical protein